MKLLLESPIHRDQRARNTSEFKAGAMSNHMSVALPLRKGSHSVIGAASVECLRLTGLLLHRPSLLHVGLGLIGSGKPPVGLQQKH